MKVCDRANVSVLRIATSSCNPDSHGALDGTFKEP
jgi:hypothetical protein